MEGSFSYISANETLHLPAQARKIKKSNPRKFLILQQTETLIFFSKENFPDLSGKGNPEKNICVLGDGTFLYFRR